MRNMLFLLFFILAGGACNKSEKGDDSPSAAGSDVNTSPSPSQKPEDDKSLEPATAAESGSTNSLFLQLSARGDHTCALLHSSGEVKCWGRGNRGQLGQGRERKIGNEPDEMGDDLSFINFGSSSIAKAVSAGWEHTCVILSSGKVKCWGFGLDGRLGRNNNHLIGDEDDEMGDNLPTVDLGDGRTAKAISAGGQHTCVILDNDKVKCWGLGTNGGLGQDKAENLGDGVDENDRKVDEMGNNLPAIDLGDGGRTAKAISAGWWHTCAILDDDTVKCWGTGYDGQLGQGKSTNIGDEEGEMGNDLPAIDLGTGRKAKAISAGGKHTCAILDDDTMKCWGIGTRGRLGYDNGVWLGDGPDEMGDDLPAVNLGGRKAKAISAGWEHTCALLDDDTVKCWGIGINGRLGQGSGSDLGDKSGSMAKLKAIDFGNGRTVRAIVTGNRHNCVLLDNNTVKCWGQGADGQLGSGNTDDLGDEPDEMGDKLPAVDLGFSP